MSGKGSSPRPFSVDRETFEHNWDVIFANKETARFEQAVLSNEYNDMVDLMHCIQYVTVSKDEPEYKDR